MFFTISWKIAQPKIGIARRERDKKLNFQAVTKWAATAASLDLKGSPAIPAMHMLSPRPWAPLQIQGGSASSQLDHSFQIPSGEEAKPT